MITNWADDPVVAVFKLGRPEHIDELLSTGHVYMNTAAYYVGLEASDARHDSHEGASYAHAATGARLSKEVHGQFVPIATLTGPVVHRSDELQAANLYCLHARRRSDCCDVFTLNDLRFGEAGLLFLDYTKFLERLTAAAGASGHRVSYELVDYVDPETHRGPLGLFRKFVKHSAQREHRVAIRSTTQPRTNAANPLCDAITTTE